MTSARSEPARSEPARRTSARTPSQRPRRVRRARRLRRLVPAVAALGTLCLALAAAAPAGAASAAAAQPAAAAPGGPGTMSYFDLARKDCVGTAAQHRLEGLVHGGRRRPFRRVRADHRQHERRHPAVHRHRRRHLHRPANPRHDLHGGGRSLRNGLHGDRQRRQPRLPAGHHLHHRPGPGHGADADPAGEPAGIAHRGQQAAPVRAAGRARQRRRRRRHGQRPERGRQHRDHRHLHRLPGAGGVQHQHRDPGGQPQLRRAHLHGPAARQPGRRGQRRLRGDGQRRPHPARHHALADQLRLRVQTATSRPPRRSRRAAATR